MGIFEMATQLSATTPAYLTDPSVQETASPPLDMLPLGSDRNTWPNIVRNKKNVIFCQTEFSYLGNRERCIKDFVQGPLLS
mmetsp:Transcript_8699/g.20523  ORF Transcript_8699/g.20523 Transcript_8699/m.20523 type:complete len:81 (+) Transcript_8699:208-450(+)